MSALRDRIDHDHPVRLGGPACEICRAERDREMEAQRDAIIRATELVYDDVRKRTVRVRKFRG